MSLGVAHEAKRALAAPISSMASRRSGCGRFRASSRAGARGARWYGRGARATSGSGRRRIPCSASSTPIVRRTTSLMTLSKWQALGNDYLLVERGDLRRLMCQEPLRLPLRRCRLSAWILEIVLLGCTWTSASGNPDAGELSETGGSRLARWLARTSCSVSAPLIGEREVEAVVRDDRNIELDVGVVEVEAEVLDLGDERAPVDAGAPSWCDGTERGARHAYKWSSRALWNAPTCSRSRLTAPNPSWACGARCRPRRCRPAGAVAVVAAAVANGWCESPVQVR